METTKPTDLIGKVLIADDLLSVRMVLRTVLSGAGHTVVAEAATGREAVSLYHLFHPDVVLMDISMPDQDGLSAMEEILSVSPQAQIIVCTAMGFRKVATDALRRGACDFAVKPFRPEAILGAVQGALRRAQAAGAAADRVPLSLIRGTGAEIAAAEERGNPSRFALRAGIARRGSAG
ncbi:MAG: response regulator [Bacteroidota bacterium]